MTGAEILTTIAQLGVAITGFTGIAIAFNRQPGRLNEFEAFRVSILFSNSLAEFYLAKLRATARCSARDPISNNRG